MKFSNEQNKIIKKLQALNAVPADEEFILRFRRVLTVQMQHDLPISPRPFIFSLMTRAALAFAAITIVISSIGLGISYASQANDPDSLWYKIKIVAEEIQLNLIEREPMESAALSAKFAQERLKELSSIENDPDAQTTQESILKLYLKYIQSAQTALQGITGEPTEESLNKLLAIEAQMNLLEQTIEKLNHEQEISTSTVLAAQSVSNFTKRITQIKSLEYSAALNITIEDEFGKDRLAALNERVSDRFNELAETWRPRFQEKVQRIIAEETLSPEKADTYSFTQDEENIVSLLNKGKTVLLQTEIALQEESISPEGILSLAQQLLAIDHDLATIEVLLK